MREREREGGRQGESCTATLTLLNREERERGRERMREGESCTVA